MENTFDNQENINIREELEKYLVHWRWFIFSIFIALLAAFTYLKFSTPIYSTTTTIMVKDEKRGGGISSEMAVFADLGMFSGGLNNIENETQILQSRSLAEKTVRRLDLNISQYNNDKVVKNDLYKNSPISISFINKVHDFDTIDYAFTIKNRTEDSFLLLDSEKEIGTYKYDEPITTILGQLIVKKNIPEQEKTLSILNEVNSNYNNIEEITIRITPLDEVLDYYLSELKITPTDKFSTVLRLSLQNATPSKAKDYLNTLVTIYNEVGVSDKRYISEKTSEFIESRLLLITDELGDVEKNVEGYKAQNSITDIPTEVKIQLESATIFEKQIIDNETELKVISSLITFLKSSGPTELLPENITSKDASSGNLISQYNQLILERNKLSRSTTNLNPTIVKLDAQISAMKASVLESLIRAESSLEITKKELATKEKEIKSKLSLVPKQEREFRIIDRQQKVKEAIYLYLFQKREETAIALAATDLNAKVIDTAKSSDTPVAPKKPIILLAAALLGLLIPFSIIYIRILLDTKIKNRLDIERNTNIPYLGDIPHSDDNSKIIDVTSRTSTAEALRIIRTNLDFMLSNTVQGEAKIIFLTSTFPKEGKTFTAVNTAATISLSGKKTLLIGLDIRNPRLDDYVLVPNKGISDYLLKKNDDINQYIVKIDGYEHLHVLPAGTIPPNPAELLMGEKIGIMFKELKKSYDYIVVDTAPVSLVTDTLLIAKYADTFIYVTRANYLDKRMLKIPNDLYKEGKLPNMSIVLNDTDTKNGYSYGYGYGYGQDHNLDKRPWWKKLLNK